VYNYFPPIFFFVEIFFSRSPLAPRPLPCYLWCSHASSGFWTGLRLQWHTNYLKLLIVCHALCRCRSLLGQACTAAIPYINHPVYSLVRDGGSSLRLGLHLFDQKSSKNSNGHYFMTVFYVNIFYNAVYCSESWIYQHYSSLHCHIIFQKSVWVNDERIYSFGWSFPISDSTRAISLNGKLWFLSCCGSMLN